MAETTMNVLNALQGQQAQLKRLIAQKMWISDAPRATLTEMAAQVTQIEALLAEIGTDSQDQLKRVK
jgi:hypothetical protein